MLDAGSARPFNAKALRRKGAKPPTHPKEKPQITQIDADKSARPPHQIRDTRCNTMSFRPSERSRALLVIPTERAEPPPPCHSDRASGANEWRNLLDGCWIITAFSFRTDFSTLPSASLEMTGREHPSKEQAAFDQALKARHSYSLGREPQDRGLYKVPGAHAPGYVCAAASRLIPANFRRMSLEEQRPEPAGGSDRWPRPER